MIDHHIDYAEVDGLQLAYQVVGEGPIDLVLVDEWATPLEARWNVPAIAGRLERLASFARVISFDKRGIGLSDRSPEVATPELWVRDVAAVADAAGAERPVIMGTHEGGPIGLLYAASMPERTEAVVLVNTGPRLVKGDGFPYGLDREVWAPNLEGIIELWRSGAGGEDHIPATAHDPWWRNWYARSRRQQASPAAGLMLMQMLGWIDVRRIASSVASPTLIVHRRDNRWWPIEGARWLSERIEGAQLVELDGADNYWWSGDADAVVDEIERFLLGERSSRRLDRQLMTIVFTDVVDSTAKAAELGDARWNELLDAHELVTVSEVERFGGQVIKSLGDGYLLRFDGPATAIRAAQSLVTDLARLGLVVRVAIHTGEVEKRADDISGLAVHLAARLMGVAEVGTIVTTGVVRGLVAGSGIEFEPMGTHAFKGIPDEWEVFRVGG